MKRQSWIVIGLCAVLSPAARGDAPAESRALIQLAAKDRAVVAMPGCADAALLTELEHRTEWWIHVWLGDRTAAERLRAALDSQGVLGSRLVVEHGDMKHLPYAANTIDRILLVGEGVPVSRDECRRVLCPGGRLIAGGRVAMTKPFPDGIDSWSHWEHRPDNNPVSTDTVIQAPYMTQFLGLPYYNCMPATTTAAGGRLFFASGHIAHHRREEKWLNTLIARNGYNGTILWTKKLPDGYLAHRSAYVATPEVFYMISLDGEGVSMLDPETGRELGQIDIEGLRGDWKWIAIVDNVLYGLVGDHRDPAETTIVRTENPHWSWGELSEGYYTPRVPWGFGRSIVAYDLERKAVLWQHEEDEVIDSRAMVIGGGDLYFYAPDKHLGCLDSHTGAPKWTNDDPEVRRLIEEEGRNLGSTPGFKTTCFAVYSPEVIVYEAQTRMNVVAVSTETGRLKWTRRKTTNNPNVMALDGRLLVGIGADGNTLAVDPETGDTIEDLGFRKRSCARLTATPDSVFCRGWIEGVTRYDRATGKVTYNGAFRPACNDGMIGANGMLYAGPWPCDCNLALLGRVGLCSADGFEFDIEASNQGNLERVGELGPSLVVDAKDWASYRGGADRSASTGARIPEQSVLLWTDRPAPESVPTAPTTAGGLVFVAGDDGRVRAIDAVTGRLKWSYMTAGPVTQPPTIWSGRAYVGSADGYIYCLDAATGTLLWRFRAAPVERRIMMYGRLCSTWPVNTGVLVDDGVAYAAAGLIDYDGTYVYALDAITGEIKWQNNHTGHLDESLRKGVSAQGTLTIANGRLWMPGGNVVSPACYDLDTGAYLGREVKDGSPDGNRGEEIGFMVGDHIIHGGRLQFSAGENIVNSGQFTAVALDKQGEMGASKQLCRGRIPPAWNDQLVVMLQGRNTVPTGWTRESVEHYLASPDNVPRPTWTADWLGKADTVGLVVGPNAVVSVSESPQPWLLENRWRLCATDGATGKAMWEHHLPVPARVGGVAVDRDGRVIVVGRDGSVMAYGGESAVHALVDGLVALADRGELANQEMMDLLIAALKRAQDPAIRRILTQRMAELGHEVGDAARREGRVVSWHLLGPVPFDSDNPADEAFVDEPSIDLATTCKIDEKVLAWEKYLCDDPYGLIDISKMFPDLEHAALYAHAEVHLPSDGEYQIRIGSDDGYLCWFNGRLVGQLDQQRGYREDNDIITVQGKQGRNQLLLKVIQYRFGWAFGVRITDPSGRPVDLRKRK